MNKQKMKVVFWGVLMILVILLSVYLKSSPIKNVREDKKVDAIENEKVLEEDSVDNPNIEGVQ